MGAVQRWLHQAIEAKEGVKVGGRARRHHHIPNARMYRKLAGMTGTALTEEQEFRAIYKLDVIPIPTNLPVIGLTTPMWSLRPKPENSMLCSG